MKLSRKTICLSRLVRGRLGLFPLNMACYLAGNPSCPFLLNNAAPVIRLENQVLTVWAISSPVTLTFQTSPKHA